MASRHRNHFPATRRAALLAAAVLSAQAAASGDARQPPGTSPEEALHVEKIEVKGEWLGTGSEHDVRRYPGARTLLDEQALRGSGARNLEEALRQAPGVQIRDETGLGVLPNIGIRGLNPLRSERVMVLVDGLPVALAPYTGTGLSLFPVTPGMVRRVDVARGGIAVRYGPNNVGGVVNIVTAPAAMTPAAHAQQRFSIAESTGRPFSETHARLAGSVGRELGLQLQADVQAGDGEREHSRTDVRNLQLDGRWLPGGDAEVRARLQYYEAEAELPGALAPAAFEADPARSQRPHDRFAGDTWRASLGLNLPRGGDAELDWTMFFHQAHREFAFAQPFDPSVPAASVSTSPRDFRVAGTEPRHTWRLRTAGITHTLTLGGRFVREEVDFVVDNRPLAGGATTRQRDWRFETEAFAGYVGDTLALADGRLEVTPGLRYERVRTAFLNRQNRARNTNRGREPLPGLTVGYRPSDATLVFANANRSLRPPQVAQVTLFGGDVASEVAWNYEIGTRIRAGEALEISAAAFHIDFDDQIEFDRGTLAFRNLGRTRHRGLELQAGWKPAELRGLALGANYTLVDAEQRSGATAGKRVPFASRHTLNLSARYATGGHRFALTGFYQSSAFSDAANTAAESANGAVGRIPSYRVWNVAWEHEYVVSGRRLALGLAVNNLLDERYYFRGVDVSPIGRVPAPGRAYLVTLRVAL